MHVKQKTHITGDIGNGNSVLSAEVRGTVGRGVHSISMPWEVDASTVNLKEMNGHGYLNEIGAETSKGRAGSVTVDYKTRRAHVHATLSGAANVKPEIALSFDMSLDGKSAEFAAKALFTNNGRRAITVDGGSVLVGDTQNQFNGPVYERVIAKAGGAGVSQPSGNTLEFALPKGAPLSLKPGKTASRTLYEKSLKNGSWETEYAFQGSGVQAYGADARVRAGGEVSITYSVKNDKEHGLGVEIPGGKVSVMFGGKPVSITQVGNKLPGETVSLDGGKAIDITASRKQLEFVGDKRRGNDNQPRDVTVTDEITLCSRGKKDHTLVFRDSVPQSQKDDNPTKISEVKIDGQPIEQGDGPLKWKIDADSGNLVIPGIELTQGKELKVSYKLETSIY
jgi:hypothetical protein